VKRIIPLSRSTTRAATAASSASVATPARCSSDSDAVPTAAASASASRTAAGERRDPRPHDFFDRLGNGKRLERIDVRRENAGQFQCEERVPTGPLVNAE